MTTSRVGCVRGPPKCRCGIDQPLRRAADGGESEHVELEPRKVFYLKRVGERTRVLELELLL